MQGGMQRMWDPKNLLKSWVDYFTEPVGPPPPREDAIRAQPSGMERIHREVDRFGNRVGALGRVATTAVAEGAVGLAGLARGAYEATPLAEPGAGERFMGGMHAGIEAVPGGPEVMETAEAARTEATRMGTGVEGSEGGLSKLARYAAEFGAPGLEDIATAAVPALFKVTKHLERAPKWGRTTWTPPPVRKSRPTLEKEAAYRSGLDERLPLAKEQIRGALSEGKMWYNLSPIYTRLQQQYGRRRAMQMIEAFAARMGPASTGSDMPATVRRALFAQHAGARGVPIEAMHPRYSAGIFNPQGHERYFSTMRKRLEGIQRTEWTGEGNPLDVLSDNLKMRPFAGALAGDYGNNPVDLHEMRFWYGDQSKTGPDMMPAKLEAPSEPQRRALDGLYRDLSAELGLTPAQTMAARWVGGAGMTGVTDPRPAIMIINDEVGKMARSMDMDAGELFDGIFSGRYDIPLGEIELAPGVSVAAQTIGMGAFLKSRRAAREELLRRGHGKAAFLGTESGDDLAEGGQKMFFSAQEGKVGGFVTPDGYIGNLWNVSDVPGAGSKLLDHMIQVAGPNAHLDHFDGVLSRIYDDMGFKETSRTPWNDEYAPADWDYEQFNHPDYIERRWGGPEGDKLGDAAKAQADEEVIGTGGLYEDAPPMAAGGMDF